jgi:hypothetical protein
MTGAMGMKGECTGMILQIVGQRGDLQLSFEPTLTYDYDKEIIPAGVIVASMVIGPEVPFLLFLTTLHWSLIICNYQSIAKFRK